MKRRFRASRLLPYLLLAGLVQAPGSAAAPGLDADPPAYRSATVCKECHPEIHRTWAGSQHATSFTDPAFQLPYDRIRRNSPGKALECERCHNPLRFLLHPDDPRAAIFAREGVTCDFCHTVEAVSRKGPAPRFRSNPGVRFGPRGGSAGKTFHATRFSTLHLSSEFCGACHEFRNAYGVAILTTYSEWAESFYRGEGVHCQFCHLPQIFDARFIDPKTKKGPSDHAMVGGHSAERLAKAIRVRASLRVTGGESKLTIRLKNELVGHKTPSGIPTHRIRMTSSLYDAAGNLLETREEMFERVVGDGAGRPVERPERIFTAAREVLKDNRIGPKESREIVQLFDVRKGRPATAEVALVYEMPAFDDAPGVRPVAAPISRTIVPARGEIPAVAGAAIAAAVILLLLGAVYLVRRRRG